MINSLIKDNIFGIVKIVILTLIFSALGIGALSFINERLLGAKSYDFALAAQFLAILALFFMASVSANVALTNFGHKLVYEIRRRLVKQILDTADERIDAVGKAKLIACLNGDIRTISFAFMSAPGLIQGSVFIAAAGAYLCYVSPKLFAFVSVWIAVTLGISAFLMKKMHVFFTSARREDDELQARYEEAVSGHRELTLNRDRARIYFSELDVAASAKRVSMTKADFYHALCDNFANVMLLGVVGMCVFLCAALGWASLQTAVTAGLTILFLRGSLIAMVAAVPTALNAKVSLDKISNLNLQEFREDFGVCAPLNPSWKSIELRGVNFSYENEGFSLKNVNFTLRRGELVFLIGKNGSGKSTFLDLLCGLKIPSGGKILLDGERVESRNLRAYQANISAVLANFYLFSQTLDALGEQASEREIDELLAMFEMDKKVSVINGKLSRTELSQGQRKRLSLLIALLESRSLLVLDEWAADQDPVFKRVFYREILPSLRERGVTILAISHDDAYFDVADRIILARDGVIRELKEGERESASKDAVEKLQES